MSWSAWALLCIAVFLVCGGLQTLLVIIQLFLASRGYRPPAEVPAPDNWREMQHPRYNSRLGGLVE